MEGIISSFFTMLQNSEIADYFARLLANPFKVVLLIIDISIVCYLFFKTYKILKNTRALQLIKGIVVVVIANMVSAILQLDLLHTILGWVMQYGFILIIVIFQPELRRALEQMGNTNYLRKWFEIESDYDKEVTCIPEVVRAAESMSRTKTGMLVVFERNTSLGEIAHTGVELDSEVSAELLVNIFVKDTPLHDGAVIIKNNKIQAASCILPLTDKDSLDRIFGTRHRAAIGVSEVTDAVVAVVSEETGTISMACNGKIIRDLTAEQLQRELSKTLNKPKQKRQPKIAKKDKN